VAFVCDFLCVVLGLASIAVDQDDILDEMATDMGLQSGEAIEQPNYNSLLSPDSPSGDLSYAANIPLIQADEGDEMTRGMSVFGTLEDSYSPLSAAAAAAPVEVARPAAPGPQPPPPVPPVPPAPPASGAAAAFGMSLGTASVPGNYTDAMGLTTWFCSNGHSNLSSHHRCPPYKWEDFIANNNLYR